MQLSTRPFTSLTVVWHPAYAEGDVIAGLVYDHFRRDAFANVNGGIGLSVAYRSAVAPGAAVPIDTDLDDTDTSIVVVLVDRALQKSPEWTGYVEQIIVRAEQQHFRSVVIPIHIGSVRFPEGSPLGRTNGLRWRTLDGATTAERAVMLNAHIAYQACRLMRRHLEVLTNGSGQDEADLDKHLRKVRVFLSHSKHDKHGQRIAHAIGQSIRQLGLAAFFDAFDIPAGTDWRKTIELNVRTSAVIAIHTDSYSSREWCRREILEAKRYKRPIVVANSLTGIEDRGFPYMGNVPVVRLDPDHADRVRYVVARIIDEVLRDFLWSCRVEMARQAGATDVLFLSHPPELISLVGVTVDARDMVYPDPPLTGEELGLLETLSSGLHLQSYNEWLAGQPS